LEKFAGTQISYISIINWGSMLVDGNKEKISAAELMFGLAEFEYEREGKRWFISARFLIG
jgi:hypothetical protein